jgi:hypothetical protein
MKLTLEEIEQEEWRDVVGLEKYYKVSNTGLVASKDRTKKEHGRKLKGRVLAINVNRRTGQTQVTMSVHNVRYKKEPSRLVAEAFIGPVPEGFEVCHKDCDHANNRLSNLAFMRPTEKVDKTLTHYCDREPVNKSEITQSLLKEYFEYIEDGYLIRRKRTSLSVNVGERGQASRVTDKNGVGARQLNFANCTIELNRAIYLYHHNSLPDYVLPIDGNRLNTRIENLKACTASEYAIFIGRKKNLPNKGEKKAFCINGHKRIPENLETDGHCKLCRKMPHRKEQQTNYKSVLKDRLRCQTKNC